LPIVERHRFQYDADLPHSPQNTFSPTHKTDEQMSRAQFRTRPRIFYMTIVLSRILSPSSGATSWSRCLIFVRLCQLSSSAGLTSQMRSNWRSRSSYPTASCLRAGLSAETCALYGRRTESPFVERWPECAVAVAHRTGDVVGNFPAEP